MTTRSCSWLTESEAQAIATQHGTPSYLYSEKQIRENAARCLGFPNPFGLTVRFAIKANPSASVLLLFQELGLHFDASSLWEVKRALNIGIEPGRISLSTQELGEGFESLVSQGVLLNCCSLNQLERFGKAFPGAEVGIRFNPGKGSGLNNRLSTGGLTASFGIWHEKVNQVKRFVEDYDLKVLRIHTHVGTGGDPDLWFQTAIESLRHLDAFPDVTTVDLGGGFKVARMPNEKESDLQIVGKAVTGALQEIHARTGRKLKLEIEPGNFLAATIGGILTRVQDFSDTGEEGYSFLKLDTGMTEILRPSLYGAQHGLRVLRESTGEATRHYAVVGHCCESGDVLTVAAGDPETLAPRELPEVRLGDLMFIEDAGAYCAGMSSKHYNSFPEAPELLVRLDGSVDLIRERQTLEQITTNERIVRIPK
jgi:diaminopimelate decarboxylase